MVQAVSANLAGHDPLLTQLTLLTSSRTHTAPHRTAPHRTAPHRTALPISVAQVVALFLLIIWVVVVPRVLLLMATFHVGLMTR